MPDPPTIQRLRGLILSAEELRSLTNWPDPVIEDYLNLLENFITLAELIDIEIDQKIEEIPTDFTDGSIPYSDSGFLVEENPGLTWDKTNDILSAINIFTSKIGFNLSAGITPDEGEISWNDGDGALNIGMPGGNVVAQVPLEDLTNVVNKSGADIANGKFVYVSGAQGNRLTIGLADNTDADEIFILGMTTEDIANNLSGYVATRGKVRGDSTSPIDTSGTSEGDKLYLSTSGGFTNTHPSGATDAVIVCGMVVKVHATDGIIELTSPQMFTIGNNYNGTMRQSIINNSTGGAAATGFTAINDLGHFATFGIAGSGNTTFPDEASVMYGPGYGDHLQAVDGNKDFVWYTDPTDSHDNSSLLNEVMRLVASGHLKLVKDNSKMMWGAADDASVYYDGTALNIKSSEVAASDIKITCGANKTIELQNPVYDDLPPVPIITAKLGSSAPSLTTFVGNIEQYTFDETNDYVIGSTELTHKYKEGTNIEMHIHWATNGVDGTDRGVKWQLEYSISNADGSAPFGDAFSGSTLVTVDTTIPANTADRSHIISDFGDITGTDVMIGAYIVWRLNRISSALTAPSADPFGIAIGFHAQQDTMGSRQEYIK